MGDSGLCSCARVASVQRLINCRSLLTLDKLLPSLSPSFVAALLSCGRLCSIRLNFDTDAGIVRNPRLTRSNAGSRDYRKNVTISCNASLISDLKENNYRGFIRCGSTYSTILAWFRTFPRPDKTVSWLTGC